jgi:thiol-disulfide isomerase/thioredoxin
MFKKNINSLTSSIKYIIDWVCDFGRGFMYGSYYGNKKDWDLVYMALIFVGIPLILLYLGSFYYKTEGMTGSNAVNEEVEVLFFYADWCPHCTKAKPIVDDIKAKFDGRTINNKTISFKYIDCTVETQDMKRNMEKYNIEGFPTIIIQTGDAVIKYDGKVENNELTTFIKDNM